MRMLAERPQTEQFLCVLCLAATALAAVLGLTAPGRHHPWLLAGLICFVIVMQGADRLKGWVLLPAAAGLGAFAAGLYLEPGQSSLFGYLFHLFTAAAATRLRWPQALGLAALSFVLLAGAEWRDAGYDRVLVDLAGIFLMTVLVKGLTDGHRRLELQASTDEMTGLLNHRALMKRGDEMLARPGQCTAMVMVDLDNFKYFNDSYGHQAGDEVLRHLGRQLRAALPPGAVAGRYGGDEFMVLIPGVGREEASAWAAGFVDQLAASGLELPGGHTVTVTASYGVAVSPTDGVSRQCVQTKADIDLYRAKGRRPVSAYGSAD